MTYPLKENEERNSNESFTDSKEISYQEQHDYVLKSWARYNIKPNPTLLNKRNLFDKVNSTLHEIAYKGESSIIDLETVLTEINELELL